MGDHDDGAPLLFQTLHDQNQLVHLLGRQHGGGLVENQDLGPPIECLHDLHPLHLPDGELIDLSIQIQLERVGLQDLLDPGLCRLQVNERPLLGRFSHDDILNHGEGRRQHQVLMDHSDPQRNRVLGRVDLRLPAKHLDGARGRPLHAVQLVHNGGLPSTVFTDEPVNLSGSHRQIYVVVGQHTRVLLDDVNHFYRIHPYHPESSNHIGAGRRQTAPPAPGATFISLPRPINSF